MKTGYTWSRSRLSDECICICILASLKLLNFTIRLHLPYTFALQSIEYHRLRQARGEGHDTHQTKIVEEKICSSSPRFYSRSMSFHVHCLTEYFFRTSILPNTYLYTRPALSFKEDLYIGKKRKNEGKESILRNSSSWHDNDGVV
jgi:hypothetical protein